ncbi:hypothetical protein N5V81_13360 [Escherichia coli]|nr:hypothetical protein [Escherichia coli]
MAKSPSKTTAPSPEVGWGDYYAFSTTKIGGAGGAPLGPGAAVPSGTTTV